MYCFLVSESSTCPYYYEVQPPNYIDCNPLGSENLAVQCTACVVKPNSITLEWMRQIGEKNMLLEDNNQTMISSIFTDSHNSEGQAVQCISSQLVLIGNSTEHFGRYVCQIKDSSSQEVYNSSSALPIFQPSTCTNSTIFASAGYTCAVATQISDVMPPLSSTWMKIPTKTVVTTVTATSLTVTTSTVTSVVTTTNFVHTSPSLASYCDGCCSMQESPSSVVDSSSSAATSAVAVTLSTLFAALIILIVITIGWMAVKVYLYRQSEMQFDEITVHVMQVEYHQHSL